jgi:replicative DNA helicase
MADIRRVPPHNKEAEQAVLASVLIDEQALDKVIDKLKPEDFYLPGHQYLFARVLKLQEMGKPVDAVTLLGSMTDEELTKAGGVDYVSSLVDILPSSANVAYYADTVRDKSVLRQLIGMAAEIAETCYGTDDIVEDVVESAEKRIFSLAEKKLNSNARSLGSLIPQTIDALDRLYKNKNVLSGVSTGFKDFNDITNGFQPSDLIIIAGRPGMGKTAFALNVALNAAYSDDSKSVAFFTLEMSSQQLVQRLLSSTAQIESAKIRSGHFTMSDWQKLSSVGGELSKINFFLDDTPAINPLELRAKCRRLKREHGLDIVFVDYLQLMSSSRGDNREQQISDISRSLKALAKELDIPVVALSQLNRGVEQRQDKRPLISDLRESGAIEQDADLIIFLYRDEVYTKDKCLTPGVAEVILSKHRHGATGDVKLAFVKEYMQFRDLAKGDY